MKKEKESVDKFAYERALFSEGAKYVAGVDEVGRGPLAGPVVCAAVIMPADENLMIDGVDDSKKLSAKKREALDLLIRERALAYSIFEVSEKEIDEINILQATRKGMREALLSLKITPDAVLTDGNMTLDIPFPQRSVIHGEIYPAYGFEKNKGYGTAAHIAAIREVGACPVHRRTFIKKF